MNRSLKSQILLTAKEKLAVAGLEEPWFTQAVSRQTRARGCLWSTWVSATCLLPTRLTWLTGRPFVAF